MGGAGAVCDCFGVAAGFDWWIAGATGVGALLSGGGGAEDYREGKPAAEPFLVAAARLGVRPEGCLVFEDAEAGVQSAVAAGMRWVRIEPKRMVDAG